MPVLQIAHVFKNFYHLIQVYSWHKFLLVGPDGHCSFDEKTFESSSSCSFGNANTTYLPQLLPFTHCPETLLQKQKVCILLTVGGAF